MSLIVDDTASTRSIDHEIVHRAMTTQPTRSCRPTVVVIGELGGQLPPGLGGISNRVLIRHVDSASELESALSETQIALLWDFRSQLLARSFHKAQTLRWVHVAGAGVDAVLTPEVAASDVIITNARGVFDRCIAETVAAMMLVFAKDILKTIDLQKRENWLHRETEMLMGQTALVVGAGGIGRAINNTLRALGVDVIGVASAQRPDPDFGILHSIDELDSLLPCADFVVAVLPLTGLTRGLFGPEQFMLMKPTARFINVGRGELVDEDALVHALRSNEISGAALDVFRTEPLPPGHPLWRIPNVIVSPHMSADFHGWLEALSAQFVENLERWLTGEPLLNVVDKKLGYVPGTPKAGIGA